MSGPFRERGAIQRSFEHLPGMNCFVCAPRGLNPHGLDLVFEETADGARTELRADARFQSYPGFLHGGILSAVLDETMAYAGVFKKKRLPFTKTLTLSFRAAVPAAEAHVCEARLLEGDDKGYRAEATIRDARGRALVTASAEFATPSLRMAKRMLAGVALEGFEAFFGE